MKKKKSHPKLQLSTETIRNLISATGGDPADDPVGSGYSCAPTFCPTTGRKSTEI